MVFGKFLDIGEARVDADGTRERGRFGKDDSGRLAGDHGNVVAPGRRDAAHGNDDGFGFAGMAREFTPPQVVQALVQIVAGGDGPPGAGNADHHGLDLVVLGGGFDLLGVITGQAFEENPFDADDSNFVFGVGRAGMKLFLEDVFAFADANEKENQQRQHNSQNNEIHKGNEGGDQPAQPRKKGSDRG